jgi:hypothetical protein
MKMLGQDWFMLAVGIFAMGMWIYTSKTEAGPVRQAVIATYQIGNSTAYDFRSSHNRICTLIIHKAGSRPSLSCT